MYNNIKIIEEDRYFIVTINREKQLNALNIEVLKELKHWVEENNRKNKILILTGSGEKAFVAGADIAEMKDMCSGKANEFSRLGQEVFMDIYNWQMPTIAAINGFALGGGCELALSCDLRFMKKGARIGQPEINLGIIPGFGGTYFLKTIIGEARAKELIYTGRQLNAVEAKEIGLIHQVIDNENFLDTVIELSANIINGSLMALKSAKTAINSEGVKEALAKERNVFADLFSGHDQKEGMEAFLNKRKPNWLVVK